MLKGGILNPDIAYLFANLGHFDPVVISDAGLPIPNEVERIDLAWKAHEPKFLDVLKEMLNHLVVDHVVMAEEIKKASPEMHREIIKLLGDIPVKYVLHDAFKAQTAKAKAIIRSGEFTAYANVMLVSGCAF
jgi:D-ribose pyranase